MYSGSFQTSIFCSMPFQCRTHQSLLNRKGIDPHYHITKSTCHCLSVCSFHFAINTVRVIATVYFLFELLLPLIKRDIDYCFTWVFILLISGVCLSLHIAFFIRLHSTFVFRCIRMIFAVRSTFGVHSFLMSQHVIKSSKCFRTNLTCEHFSAISA